MVSELIRETPWWVYCILVYLIIVGLWSAHPRVISLKRLFLLPFLLLIWNLSWLWERLDGHSLLILLWPFGLMIGFCSGWLLVNRWRIGADRSKELLSLPATWSTLFLILLVFSIRYFFIYNYKVHPEAAP